MEQVPHGPFFDFVITQFKASVEKNINELIKNDKTGDMFFSTLTSLCDTPLEHDDIFMAASSLTKNSDNIKCMIDHLLNMTVEQQKELFQQALDFINNFQSWYMISIVSDENFIDCSLPIEFYSTVLVIQNNFDNIRNENQDLYPHMLAKTDKIAWQYLMKLRPIAQSVQNGQKLCGTAAIYWDLFLKGLREVALMEQKKFIELLSKQLENYTETPAKSNLMNLFKKIY